MENREEREEREETDFKELRNTSVASIRHHMGLHESATGEKINMAKKSVTKKIQETENSLEENPQMGHDARHEEGIFVGNTTDSWPSSF